MSAGGVSRRRATARDGVRADHDERARARRETRASRIERASTRRVEGLEKYRRVDVAIAVSRAVGRERCAARGRVRGRRRGRRVDGILTRSPIQSVRTSPSPVVAPFADILAAASQTPVANEDASTRATFISVSPCFGRWHERVGADRESARAEDVDAIEMARSRVRAPKMRRPRAPLECPSAGRPRREGRQRAKLFDDEPRRHLLTASEGTAQVATTRASGGSDCLSREFEN